METLKHTVTKEQTEKITVTLDMFSQAYKADKANYKIVADSEGNEEKKYIRYDGKKLTTFTDMFIVSEGIEKTKENKDYIFQLCKDNAKNNGLFGSQSYVHDEQIDKDLENVLNSFLNKSMNDKKYIGTFEGKQFNRLTMFRNKIYYVCSNNTLKDFTLNPKFMNVNTLFGTTDKDKAKVKALLSDVLKVTNIIEFIKDLKPKQATTKK